MLEAAHSHQAHQLPHHHHHHPQAFQSPQYLPNKQQQTLPHGHIDTHGINSVESRKKIPGEDEDYSDAAFCSQGDPKCSPDFVQEIGPHHHHHHHECFGDEGFRTGDDVKPSGAKSRSRAGQGKMKDSREELSDGGTYYHKKPKGGGGGGDYKKDREEWSDSAIGCLLDAYTEKYVKLNRGNLRGRDWEEVACIVSERCERQKSAKSIEQCKNKVDNLKKRYKSERHRLVSGSATISHWPWYKKMDQIVGSSVSKTVSDEDKSMVGGNSAMNMARPVKRFAAVTPSPVGLSNNLKPKTLQTPRWRRVLLKISGTALAGNAQNVDPKVTSSIAREIAAVNRLGVEVAVVVGGRNFFCGASWVQSTGLDRASADQIGMMATVMNSIILQADMENLGIQTRVQTAFKMSEIAEPYIRRRAIRHLEKGRVVIFGAGTGNPFFSTDTAAALRASEINAEVVLKGTNVDGVYDPDPRKNNIILDHISYRDFVAKGLQATAMDLTAITFCEENCMPVVIFNLHEPGNISRALTGEQIGTLINQTGKIG